MTARNERFIHFARMLLLEIDKQIGEVADWRERNAIDDEETIKQELASRLQNVVARRTYDLVQHTVGHACEQVLACFRTVPAIRIAGRLLERGSDPIEYLDECGKERTGSLETHIRASIPDMRAWRETTSQ